MKSLPDARNTSGEKHPQEIQSWQFTDLVDPLDDIPENDFDLTPTAVTLVSKRTDVGAVKWEPGTITRQFQPISGFSADKSGFEEGVSEEEAKIVSLIEQQLNQAEQTLADAKLEAAEIIREAQEVYEQQKQTAIDEGLDNARNKTLDKYDEIQKLVADTFQWHENVIKSGEELVINLVVDISKKLFSSGFTLDRKVLHQAYARAVAEAKSLGDLRIHVNPNDEITIDPLWTTQITSFIGQEIEWVPNQNIKPGGCLIEGQFGTVDAKVESQLETLLALMQNTMKGTNN